MQKIIPELDTIYISAPYGFTTLMTKQFSNYKYRKNGILLDCGVKKITRYAKDYEIHGTPFTLLLISFTDSLEAVENKINDFADKMSSNNKYKSLAATATLVPQNLEEKI